MANAIANTQDLIAYVAREAGITKVEAKRVIQHTLQGINELVADKDKLLLREFGIFELRYRKARVNSKPIQGKPSVIQAREVLHFTPSRLLSKEVDY